MTERGGSNWRDTAQSESYGPTSIQTRELWTFEKQPYAGRHQDSK
jgi:hypothetical protein